MLRTVRTRYAGGAFQPLEALDLKEGEEVLISFDDLASPETLPGGDTGAGGWAGLVDAEQLKRDIYASRQTQTRRTPEL